MTRLAITSTRVLTPDGLRAGTVVVTDGVIRSVQPAPGGAEQGLDVGDAVLMPGVVDVHVHVNEPGRTEWEGFATATRAAAAGGVTTIVDMPLNSIPVTTTVPALEAKAAAAAGQAMVDYGFWGGAVPANLPQLEPLAEAGVLGFKAFLVPSGIPEFEHSSEMHLEATMRVLARRRLPLLVHAELPDPIASAAAGIAGNDPRQYRTFLASRPPDSEHAAIDLVIGLCEATGCPVHVVHLSAGVAAPRLADAKRRGLPITVETCPHYLHFAAEEIADGATAFKCAPPIRDAGNRATLRQALRTGVIDLIASDHSPAPPELKCQSAGDFMEAWGGIASLQLLLPATWTVVAEGGSTLEDLGRWLCERPAQLAGLGRQKGRIAPGYDADLVVFDPDATFPVDPARLSHRHPLTPYQGMRLRGTVRRSFVRGICVYDNGRFPSAPIGRRVYREAA